MFNEWRAKIKANNESYINSNLDEYILKHPGQPSPETQCGVRAKEFMKLSKAQTELLKEIGEKSKYVADYYPPAKKLVEYGLAKWSGNHLQITEDGERQISFVTATKTSS